MPAMNTLITNEGVTQEGADGMNVYVFMKSVAAGDGKIYPIVQTSIFISEEEKVGYWASLISHKVENNVLAIPQGTYRHRLMQVMALRRGLHFRAVSFETRDLQNLNYAQLKDRATLTYSTAERCTFMSILKTNNEFFTRADVVDEFGGKSLGIGLKYTKKLMKRCQEFLRSAHMTMFIERGQDTIWTTVGALPLMSMATGLDLKDLFSEDKLVVAEFKTPAEMVELLGADEALKLYDGINMIDMEVVIACLREQMAVASTPKHRTMIRKAIRELRNAADVLPVVGRYIFRLLGSKGLIKGDALAVVGLKERTGADVIYHTENLKDEIWTLDGETIIALENHEGIHPGVKWDRQSTTNFRFGLSREQEGADILSIQADMEAVIEDQEIPDWMLLTSDAHVGVTGYTVQSTKELANQDFHRLQSYGIEVLSAQNYGSVWLGGTVRRMTTFLNRETGFNKKPFIPMSHAISMGVMTYRAVEDMAGINLNDMDQTKVNYMGNVGALFPTNRWLATIDLHGGEDLDDTNNLHDRLVYCSDAAHLALLVEDGVIGADVVVPTTPEEARELLLVLRSPNGAGEYSIEVPAVTKDDPTMPLLDLAKMPRGITYLRTQAHQVEIVTDPEIVYGGFYTRANAGYVVEAQADNPGIGQVANMLMVWHDAVGSTLPVGIPALEDMVDTVQQTHDKVAIAQVAEVPALIGQQLASLLESKPGMTVDKLFVTERLRYTKGEFMDVIRSRMARRRPTELNSTYTTAVRAIQALIKSRLLQMRSETKLYKAVMGMRLDNHMDFAKAQVEDMRYMFKVIAKANTIDPYDSPFLKVAKRMAHTDAVRAVVEEKVALLMSEPDLMKYRIVAMYKYIVQPTRIGQNDWPLGTYDQVIFRSAGADVALFDLLGQVVKEYNLLG